MKLGVFTPLFNDLSFEEMLDQVAAKGLETVEIGTGASPGDAHLKIDTLLHLVMQEKNTYKKLRTADCQFQPYRRMATPFHQIKIKHVRTMNCLEKPSNWHP